MNVLNENNKWELNRPIGKLTIYERKDAMVLLFFLNCYGDDKLAFSKLKQFWIDNIYKLPNPRDQGYSSIKSGRYNTLKKMKRIYQLYLVEALEANQP
jgi:hypothetical protein